ncbi:sigma-70 family RNA polymerase sigma factor [Streptomyces gibsoniae]|uniref:Sigma-70 family RNA polymerase sigma factor n=1 Tax=Streptomyces gibsoniae TaxID=3075529 RepID=A0ABU2U4F1_9ACTN|nr:sigma-70 family RNA polymerase sigma factor [Streptomyces sp. DSM 41699]MDT0468108.1 sigma-70 family RNA polymerase sigma factor [Streptomyces sp. DSM 41699]
MNAPQSSAFEILMSNHKQPLHAYVARLLHDRHAAEDIVQETFLRAWMHADLLCTTGSVHGWLRTVARNLLIDKSRKFATQREFADTDGLEAAQDDHVGIVLDRLDVVQLLRKVSEEQRVVLVHRYLCGRSLQETAHVLGIPEGTVKSRQHYALDSLRKIPR